MGLIISRFRKKPSTKEVLADIQKEVEAIEEYKNSTERQGKRLVGRLVVYSSVLYLIAAIFGYLYFFPSTIRDHLIYAAPLAVFPILVYLIKTCLTWYYRWKVNCNESKLSVLREKKEKILEQVMETETYKVAREILETYAPDQLRKSLVGFLIGRSPIHTPIMSPERIYSPPSGEVRQRIVPTATPSTQPRLQQIPPVLSSSLRSTQVPQGIAFATPLTRPSLSSVHGGATGGGSATKDESVAGEGIRTGPPMPRPVLPRERGVVDRFIEYLVGDGPANRYALICRECESHNGMALKDEFEYLSFRCAYCFYWNRARKQKPSAPRLETLMPKPPTPTFSLAAEEGDDQSSSQEGDGGEEEDEENDEGDGRKTDKDIKENTAFVAPASVPVSQPPSHVTATLPISHPDSASPTSPMEKSPSGSNLASFLSAATFESPSVATATVSEESEERQVEKE